jgi:NADH:ubiquinone oxidoreductase subunit 5 (subunit L)/multisubunit Na+/H+ antiporter MnhA subunit
MFMAAGLIYAALGHDRIDDLAGVARAMPVTVLAFALAGLALMGILPSGAYLAKKVMLAAADGSGQWWWTAVLHGGAAFTAGYMVLVLSRVLRRPTEPPALVKRVHRMSELAALALAIASLLLGLAALGPMPSGLVSNPFSAKELGPLALVLVAGAAIALAMSRRPLAGSAWAGGPLRRIGVAAAATFEALDRHVRQWPSATVLMLALAALFMWLLATGAPA